MKTFIDKIVRQPSWRHDLLWLGLLTGTYFCIGLGAHAYLIPSEARYIEIPRQMLASGDWLTPHINGVPYFEKPPLFYWLQAMALGLFGMQEWAGRIVTALLTTLTCLTTYACARMLYGRRSGWLAAGVLATSLMGYGLAHVAMLDVPVSVFITACLTCFLGAQQTTNIMYRRRLYHVMYVASALAMMSKGLIGIVIPGMVIGAWIMLTWQWSLLKQAQLVSGTVIFLAIVVPWHLLMAQKHPDFLNFYFIHEHFTRYLTDAHKRTAPWWLFFAVTPVGLIPWVGLLPATLRRIRLKNPTDLFLLLWIVLPLLFFSTSHSKLLSYIFPIFPPLAILLGRTLGELLNGHVPKRSLRISAVLLIGLLGVALVASQLLPALPGKAGHKMAALTAISWPQLLPIALALLWLGYTVLKQRSVASHISALALVGASIGFTANYVIAPLDTATTKPLASPLKARLSPDDLVVAYGTYWQDLPVYLERNITVVDWTGELNFGVTHYPQTHEWMMPAEDFWPRCASAPHDVYVFISEETFASLAMPDHCKLHIIAQHGKTLLLEKSHD